MSDVAVVVVVVLVPYDVVAPASSIFLEPSFAFPARVAAAIEEPEWLEMGCGCLLPPIIGRKLS